MKATKNKSWPTLEPAKLLQFVEMAHLLHHDRLAQEVFQRVVGINDTFIILIFQIQHMAP